MTDVSGGIDYSQQSGNLPTSALGYFTSVVFGQEDDIDLTIGDLGNQVNIGDISSESLGISFDSYLSSLSQQIGSHKVDFVGTYDLNDGIIGNHSFNLKGIANVSKLGEVTFNGMLSSLTGEDSYNFNPGNRPFVKESLTTIGRFITGLFNENTPVFNIKGQMAVSYGITHPSDPPLCFPASTPISTAAGERPIANIQVGDLVQAFDAAKDKGRGGLALKRVKRLYQNVTQEWVKLSWVENGQRRELISTPGHHFLDEFGQFPTIDEMLRDGRATVVLASGALAEVTAEEISYAPETAHLFEQARVQTATFGSLALKPESTKGWQSYNFEVEDLHTYIAGGVRVHNNSGVLGKIGNSIDAALNRLGPIGDAVGDIIGGTFHSAGNLVSSAMSTVKSLATGAMEAYSSLANSNIVGAIGSIASGVVSAASSAISGVADAIGSAASGLANAVSSAVSGIADSFGSSSDSNSSDSSSSSGGEGASGKPLIVDMDDDGIELTKLDESVTNFDFDDDGYPERTAWTAGDDALLVFDLDNDNRVTQSKEIAFAKWTDADDTDLEALATHFDTNKDKALDSRDAGWSTFKLWQDRDADGVVDDGEMITLDEAGVKSIGLEAREGTGKVLSDGTVIHGLVDVQRSDGSIADGADVAFAYNAFGFRSYKDESNNIVYEFEDGDVQKIKAFDEDDTDFSLGDDTTQWIGAEGNARANAIDASGKVGDALLNGGAGDDTLIGGAGNDYLIGGEGADNLQGGAGSDTLFVDGADLSSLAGIDGGEGYDQLIMTDNSALNLNVDDVNVEAARAAGGDDRITGSKDDVNYAFAGGGGNDTLTGGGGGDLLSGEDGNDALVGNSGQDRLFGGAGDDTLEGGEDADFLAGGAGADSLKGGAGDDIYYYNRGDGADSIHDRAEGVYKEEYTYEEQVSYQYNVSVRRGGGKSSRWVNETRTGYRVETRTGLRDAFGEIDGGIDTLQFGAGVTLADIVLTRSGDDMVVALRDGDNADVISDDSVTIIDWADQKNRIENFAFADGTKLDFSRILHGQHGLDANDALNGTDEGDFLSGGNGSDTLNGHAGRDVITGGDGADVIDGGADKDFLFGDAGYDTVRGQDGDDYLIAGGGDDLLQGGDGKDALAGQDGDDRLEGGAGDDILLGGKGADVLKGGAGNDTYVYFRGDGRDEILDEDAWEETYGEWYFSGYRTRLTDRGAQVTRLFSYRTRTRTVEADGGDDTLQFGFTIALEDLFFQIQGEDMLISVRDPDDLNKTAGDLDDQLTIKQWADSRNRIETFEFASGLALDMSNVTYANSGYESDDNLAGTSDGNILAGGGGSDTLTGLGGDDYLIGGGGDDTLEGGDGNDDLFGGEGDDHLAGGDGEDYLLGGAGDDTLNGGASKDVLTGGRGDDLLNGGRGDDVYIFNRGDGKDTIDETAHETVQEAYQYTTPVQKSVRSGKSWRMAWVNETRTGYRSVTRAAEGGDDTLQFGANIDVSDLIVSMAGDDLVIQLQPTAGETDVTDQVTVKNWTTPEFRVENLRFTNDFAIDLGHIDHAQTGDESANTLSAFGDQASWLGGGAGDDALTSSSKDDILFGGAGNDELSGGAGNDVYIFNRGDGQDSLEDSGSGTIGDDPNNPGGDKLLFGENITIEDLVLQRDGDDLVIHLRDRENPDTALDQLADSLRIKNWASSDSRIEVLQFFNGTDFAISHVVNSNLGQDILGSGSQTPVNDTLAGSSAGDWMDGLGGHDTLHGGAGDDLLFGRGGDDLLYGEEGDDILSGDIGDDYLSGGGADDILAGGQGDDQLYGDGGKDALMGGEGDDQFDGGAGDDVIVGDVGDDIYTASTGHDIYRFGYGDGNDVYKGTADANGTDVFVMEDNVKKEALWFERIGNDLVMKLLGGEDSVTFGDWFSSSDAKYIHGFQAGESFLNYSDVNRLVSAMASFDPNDGTTAYGVTALDLPESVQVAVSSAWKAA